MSIKSIFWKDNFLMIIDQTKLPQKLVYLNLSNTKEVIEAIKSMKIRGAPALAAAASFGLYLGIRDSGAKTYSVFKKELESTASMIKASRPTAVNLFWALERIIKKVEENKQRPVSQLKRIVFKEASNIIEEDRLVCRRLSQIGSDLIEEGDQILTICNTGSLATVDYGTALGVIYEAKKQGKKIKVYACETRPLLQGARLTCWELKYNKVDVTLICDNMAGYLMQKGYISKVIVGADRIALNGDTANKIGTYTLAVLADFHRLPFYVAAPLSSFDPKIKDGGLIPIEERSADEITKLFFKRPIAPEGVKILNPAFDVTPHRLISAFITEKGIIRPPFDKNIKRLLK